jgi:hypothetical protein
MNCAEFQKVLPYIIETGGNADEEAHLRACPVCSDLVTDLRYIAEQAKLLLPMHDPSPKVWESIQDSLQREGLVKPARARGRLLGSTGETTRSGARWMSAATLVLLLLLGVAWYRRGDSGRANQSVSDSTTSQARSVTTHSDFTADDDQQLLAAVAVQSPQLKSTYESNLKLVNANISDAEQNVKQNPTDDEARQQLMNAYDQKAMVYDMASRSLQ